MFATFCLDAALVLSMLAVFILLPASKAAPAKSAQSNHARFGDSASRAPGIR